MTLVKNDLKPLVAKVSELETEFNKVATEINTVLAKGTLEQRESVSNVINPVTLALKNLKQTLTDLVK